MKQFLQVQTIITLAVALPLFLLAILTADPAWASSQQVEQALAEPLLQATAVPTVTLQNTSTLTASPTYSLSLASLGYGETSLESPLGQANFTFTFPEDWSAAADGQLNLNFSYSYNQGSGDFPALFGDLSVSLDDQTLEIFTINARELDHQQLTIPLPASLLNSPNARHALKVSFEASFLCEFPHQARLLIHPTTTLTLGYGLLPLELDLARYPRPFYQQSFTPSQALFILPSSPNSQDFSQGLAVAAKLGDLAGNRLVISATTASDFRPSTSTPEENHLFVIGRPENNSVLSLLSERGDLPVSLHERQLAFMSQAPATVAPGEPLTYNFTLTNTLNRNIELSLLNSLSAQAEVVSCTPDCLQAEPGLIRWKAQTLARGQALNFSLNLKLADALTGAFLENIVTLTEAEVGPLNAETITSEIGVAGSESEPQQLVAAQEGYFFIYNGRAVAENDGIIQEISSPWNERRAVLVITGLSEQAVEKASQALSSEARLPGMKGNVALIKETSLGAASPLRGGIEGGSGIEASETANQRTLADLGYPDQTLQGLAIPSANYNFNVPFGWQLGRGAALELYFSHSQLVAAEGSALTVFLNRQPLASVALNEATANAGYLKIPLTGANIRSGRNNLLTIQPTLAAAGKCLEASSADQMWLVIDDRSTIFLPHRDSSGQFLNLANYPYPFEATRTLTDVLFALPETPTHEELLAALRIAAALGDSTAGPFIHPRGLLGADIPADELANYHIIALGLPSRQPLLQEVNDQLPQPFLPGTNEIEQKLNNVVFRLPAGLSLGYLELIASPWNEERAFLAITGTTAEAVGRAVETLLTQSLEPSNLALIKEEGLELAETRELIQSSLVTTTTAAAGLIATTGTQPTVTPAPPTPAAGSVISAPSPALPLWLVSMIILTGLGVVGSLALAYWQARRRQTAGS